MAHDAETPRLRRVADEARRAPRAEFAGMSYDRASRTAEALIRRAVDSCSWYALPEALAELRAVMERRGHVPRRPDDVRRLEGRPAEAEALRAAGVGEAARPRPIAEGALYNGVHGPQGGPPDAGPGAYGEYMDRG